MECVRDSQRSKVYAFQWTLFEEAMRRESLTLGQCQNLLDEVLETYSLFAPRVKDGRGCRHARFSPTPFGYAYIVLPRWARNKPVVLHEAAHAAAHAFRFYERHGPAFVRLFIDMISRHAQDLLSGTEIEIQTLLENRANENKVKLAPPVGLQPDDLLPKLLGPKTIVRIGSYL